MRYEKKVGVYSEGVAGTRTVKNRRLRWIARPNAAATYYSGCAIDMPDDLRNWLLFMERPLAA